MFVKRQPQRAYASLADWVGAQESHNHAARELGISKGYLSMLLSRKRGRRMPIARALDIARKANIPIESLTDAA